MSLAQEAERNARELLAEEERVKRKAEKKKLKKKVSVTLWGGYSPCAPNPPRCGAGCGVVPLS